MSDGRPRREFLRRLGQAGLVLGAAGAAGALGLFSPGRWRAARVAKAPPDRRVPDLAGKPRLAVARGEAAAAAVRAAVDAVGGIERFVHPGETVLVKPNMAWDRTPEQGANTDPDVVAEVVRLCFEARAARVVVADVPVHDAVRVAERSGIARAARSAGAEVQIPPGAGFVLASIGGVVLDDWEVFAPALAADRLINVPVVKVHGLTRLTCGLKNGYGLLGGTRARLHQQISASIVDLSVAFRPTLTVVDATRVMLRGGPTGGRLDDVKRVGAIAAGTDPVALDAWGATLLGLDPREVPHVALAETRGLGSIHAGTRPLGEIHAGA
ncbi:MAG: DUF362 domain-containing protein [Acidobacteriia bacterium]|nr:DUF362 domain-containing protein [Terriglobia bacterium]